MSSIAIRRAAPAAPATAASGVFALASNSQAPAVLPIPGKLALEGKKFTVRAEGNAQLSLTTITATFSLLGFTGINLPANPITIASWTTLGAGTAITGATSFPWWMEANLIFDSVSGLLQGTFSQMGNNTFVAPVKLTAGLTGLQGTNQPVGTTQPSDPVANLALGLALSGAGTVNLMNFELGF